VVASVFLTVSYYAIPLLELKNFWFHYSGACGIAIGFYWHWVVYIKGPNLGIPFIDDWFNQSKIFRHNVDISQYIKGNALAVHYSKGKNLWGMVAWLGMGLFLLYVLGYQRKSYFWGFFMGYFSLTGAVQFGRYFLNSSPQLVLREDGLATPKLSFVTWESVKLIQLRDTSSGESSSTNLDIYVNEAELPDDTLRADLLNIGNDKLRTSISHFAKREVPFV
jgi:hypothetical protein